MIFAIIDIITDKTNKRQSHNASMNTLNDNNGHTVNSAHVRPKICTSSWTRSGTRLVRHMWLLVNKGFWLYWSRWDKAKGSSGYLYVEVARVEGSGGDQPGLGSTWIFWHQISGSFHQELAVLLSRHDVLMTGDDMEEIWRTSDVLWLERTWSPGEDGSYWDRNLHQNYTLVIVLVNEFPFSRILAMWHILLIV